MLIFNSHTHFGVPNHLFPRSFPNKTVLFAFQFLPNATLLPHIILPDLITVAISEDEHNCEALCYVISQSPCYFIYKRCLHIVNYHFIRSNSLLSSTMLFICMLSNYSSVTLTTGVCVCDFEVQIAFITFICLPINLQVYVSTYKLTQLITPSPLQNPQIFQTDDDR